MSHKLNLKTLSVTLSNSTVHPMFGFLCTKIFSFCPVYYLLYIYQFLDYSLYYTISRLYHQAKVFLFWVSISIKLEKSTPFANLCFDRSEVMMSNHITTFTLINHMPVQGLSPCWKIKLQT